MADTTFVNGTVIEAAWLNDVNRLTYDLPNTSDLAKGDALVPVRRNATGAVVVNLHAEKEREGFTPEQFGAIGDGVTDDTAAIVLALAACLANKKPLLIPNTYVITTTITLPQDVSIYGLGSSENCGFIYTGTNYLFSKVFDTHTSDNHMNSTYSNFFVRGTGTTSSAAFYLQYADHSVFDHLRIENFTNTSFGSGIRLKECYWTNIQFCKMDNIGRVGIWMESGPLSGCNATTVGPGNRINANNMVSCTAVEANGQTINIFANDFTAGNNGVNAINCTSTDGLWIAGNYIEQWAGPAIRGANAVSPGNTRTCIENGNINSAASYFIDWDNGMGAPNTNIEIKNIRFSDASGASTCIKWGSTTNYRTSGLDLASALAESDKAALSGSYLPLLTYSTTWNPGSIAGGSYAVTDITTTNYGLTTSDGVLGVTLSSMGTTDMVISAFVRSADVVRVVLQNKEAGAIDLASGTLNLWFVKTR